MEHLKVLRNITILLLITGLMLIGTNTEAQPTSGAKPIIKIAYTNFFTGRNSAMGKIVDGTVKQALQDFHKTSKVQIELGAYDVGDSPVTAKNAYEQLLDKNPPILVTFISSTTFIGVAPLLEKARLPVVLSNMLPSIFEHGWDFVFGMQTIASMEAPIAISYYAEKLGKKRFAVLASNDDTGKATLESLDEVVKQKNIEILPIYFNSGDNDYTPNITAARRLKPDMYYVGSVITPDLGKLVKQMRQLGIQEPISVNNYLGNADFLALLTPQEAEGVYGYTCAYYDAKNPKIQDFAKRLKESSGVTADPTSLFVYDCAMVSYIATEKGGGDRKKILEVLRGMEYTGLAGSYKFDSKGRGRHDTNILQIGPNKTIKFLANVKYTGTH